LAVGVVLAAIDVGLAEAARCVYDEAHPDSFRSALATGVLLNGAVVAIFGAVLATMLSFAAERRSREEAAADKRLGLFRRMREAHVRVALSQQILRARRDIPTYHERMFVVQEVVKDLEEIREEVKVSGGLYDDDDRRLIMKGIAVLSLYLDEGVSEYVEWCNTAQIRRRRPDGKRSWIVVLVADHDQDKPAPDEAAQKDLAGDDWESPGRMPPCYEEGLEQSKLIMRHYVYGLSRTQRAAKRQWVLDRCDIRKVAAEAATAPLPAST
jgi:hypothetical protein